MGISLELRAFPLTVPRGKVLANHVQEVIVVIGDMIGIFGDSLLAML